MGLFTDYEKQSSIDLWRPPELPSLDGISDIILNWETNGLRWWDGDEPIGFSLRWGPGKFGYFPFGHLTGGNLDKETCRRWAQRELRNKRITNQNVKFECHNARVFGCDFEEQGCQVSDISHYAGLLDDHRLRFSLNTLIADYLGEVQVPRLDESRMAYHHPGEMAARSIYNVETVYQLREKMWPLLTEQGLHKVRQLEDECIFATVEMEKNGVRIDIEKLDRWIIEIDVQIEKLLREIGVVLGRRTQEVLFGGGKPADLFNPDSPKEMVVLFERLGIPLSRTAAGRPSFTNEVLKNIEHPTIKTVRRASRLIDIQSKLESWSKSINRSTGILRYALHQLRAQKDNWDENSAGTISGRYSSTKIDNRNDEGTNIQSIAKPAKQRVQFGYADDDSSHDDELFLLRELCIAADKHHFFASDMMQVEYRLFVAETASERLLKFYENDPKASYHRMIHGLLKLHKPDLPYRRAKDINFAVQYGAGIRKMAVMLGFISNGQYHDLLKDNDWKKSPLLKETFEIKRVYNQAVPEVKPMIDKAQDLAKTRGYIKTIMGRRTRFPNGDRTHKALNARVQGSGADIMKQKLIEVRQESKKLGFILRVTLHDEICGCSPNPECAQELNKILNRQSFNIAVPILWESGTGPNWAHLKDIGVDS